MVQYITHTVAELRRELGRRQKSTQGDKATLIARLTVDDEENRKQTKLDSRLVTKRIARTSPSGSTVPQDETQENDVESTSKRIGTDAAPKRTPRGHSDGILTISREEDNNRTTADDVQHGVQDSAHGNGDDAPGGGNPELALPPYPATVRRWTSADRGRLDFNVYEDLAQPDRCVAFLQMAQAYMNHLRQLSQEQADDEYESVKRFVKMINNDVAWPLVKTVVQEFRRPITSTQASNSAMQYVLRAVQARTLENKVRRTYIPGYEQKLIWDRMKASVAYLAFIKDKDSAAKTMQEVDAMTHEIADAMVSSGVRPSDMLDEGKDDNIDQ